MPLLGIGSTKGLVLLSANPGWKDPAQSAANVRENAFRLRSLEDSKRFTREYFSVQLEALGKRTQFWGRSFALLELLGWPRVQRAAGLPVGAPEKRTAQRWEMVQNSGLFGAWELLPWHSERDGFSSAKENALVRELCEASLRAVLRTRPELLVVASMTGYDMLRRSLPDAAWSDTVVQSSKPVKVSRATFGPTTLLAVRWQMFARNAPLSVAQLLGAAKELGYSSEEN